MISKKNLFGTDKVTQICIVVKDIEKTAADYADFFGVKKPSISMTETREKTHAEFKGEPTDALAKLAFFRFKNITLELIEPAGGPSTWKEWLDTHGEGVHHIAFNVRDTKGKVKALADKGIKVVQRGDFRGGQYVYLDATGPLKIVLELLGNDAEKR
jgi:catechol 2,3-dioxygenase-like lactoylglutathione lyase family enzyme